MKGYWNLDGSCSVCGKHTLQSYGNFCCYCGADMREVGEIVYSSDKLTVNSDTFPYWDYSLPTITNIERGASLPHIESEVGDK